MLRWAASSQDMVGVEGSGLRGRRVQRIWGFWGFRGLEVAGAVLRV